jgi:parallel beta-helix repeat protein
MTTRARVRFGLLVLAALAVVAYAAIGLTDRRAEAATTVVVRPGNMQGWGFFDDNGNGGTGDMVSGPGTPPLGAGSAHLAVSATNQGYALGVAYPGTRFDTITSLRYSTYRTSGASALAISLAFNVDYDVTDGNTAFQGRLTFEPYYTNTVLTGTWQTWDTLTAAGTGNWWASGVIGAASCPIGNPCTWSEVLTAFPDVGVHSTFGAIVLKAGSGWATFDGNADALLLGVSGSDTTYDFEPDCTIKCFVNAATGDDSNGGASAAAAKKTIQAAVAAVTTGGTINVAAGTYNEIGQIVINKHIAILGAGAGSTIIRPTANTGSSGNARGWFLVDPGFTFNLRGVTLDGTGFKVWQAIRHQGRGTISDCAFKNIKFEESGPSYAGTGIAAFGSPAMNVDVTNCAFGGIGRVGVLYFGTGITSSTYSDNTYAGKGAGDWLDYAVEVGAGANATIKRSTIGGNTGVASSDGSTSAGVLVTTFFGAGTAASVSENFISGSTTGVAVGFDGSDTSVATVFNNSLTGNTKGVESTAQLVNASANWWGTNTPGGVAGQVSASVDYTPWLDAGTDTSGTTGFQGDFSTLDVDDDSPQSGATTRVQEGVDLVTASTVNVMPGTYEEQVEITDPTTIVGSGVGTTIIKSPVTLTKFFTTSANNYPIIFARDTNGVTVQDLTVDGAGRGNGNFRFVGIGYSNAGGTIDTVRVTGVRETPISGTQHGNAIFANASSGTARALAISNADVDDYQKNGMTLSGANLTATVTDSSATGAGPVNFIAQNGFQLGFGAGGTIEDSETSGHTYTPATFAATGMLIFQAAPGVLLRHNNVHDNMEGIFIQDSDGVIVDGASTIIDSSDTGVFFFLTADGEFNDNTATDNTVAVWIADSNNTAVQDSTISNNEHGVIIDGDSTGVDVLGNDILNNTGASSGIHVEPFGGFDPSGIEVHFNNIVGNGGSGGLGLFSSSANLIDAENNWWGACDGPSGPGGSGSGDPVSTNVDFTPFLVGKCDKDGDLLTNDSETFIHGTDPLNPDTDGDGCADGEELLLPPNFGGVRDPLYFWDFYDVWTRPNVMSPWTRDKVVTVTGDLLAVAQRFGAVRPGGAPAKSVALTEALTPPTSNLGYHTDYDRGPLVGPNVWDSGPPDGAISVVVDLLQAAKQVGHSCLAPPP